MLTASDLATLCEVATRAGARAATSFRELLGEPAHATDPEIWWVEAGQGLPEVEYARTALEPASTVVMHFEGPFEGTACFAVSRALVAPLVEAVLRGRDGPAEEILVEVGNVLVNGFMGDISNVVRGELCYSVPKHATTPAQAALVRETACVVSHTALVAPTLGIEASLYVAMDAAGIGDLTAA